LQIKKFKCGEAKNIFSVTENKERRRWIGYFEENARSSETINGEGV